LNAQSINNKFDKIRDLTLKINPIVLGIQEVWGKNESTDYSISNYHKPEIKARKGGNNAGGGVGVWIRKDIDYAVISSPFTEKQIETIAIHLTHLQILVFNVYRPFGDCISFINELHAFISQVKIKFPHSDLIVMGDFNIDLSKQDRIAEDLIDTMCTAGFLQQVTIPTRITENTKSLIDHVFTNSRKKLVSNVIMTDIADHLPIHTHYIDWKHKQKKIKITKRWLKPDDYGKLDAILKEIKWTVMAEMDLEEKTDFLIKQINEALDQVAPVITKQIRNKQSNHWVTLGIKTSSKINNHLYKKMKKSGRQEDREHYKKRKKLLDRLVRYAKNMQIKSDLKEAGTDTRKLWAIINNSIDRKQCSHKLPSAFNVDNSVIANKKDIAQAFNKYFAEIGSKMADSIANPTNINYTEFLPEPHKYDMEFRQLTQEEVEKIMKKQQPKLSHGLDTINNRMVKECAASLSVPMTMIINESLKEGEVPLAFKTAVIKPLYKKGPSNELGNYRPVSLLSALSKILEKAVCAQLNNWLYKEGLYCPTQYGFRPKSSTVHAVQDLMNQVAENAALNQSTVATFIDLSKAFDCLQYDKLFGKLDNLGVRNKELSWFMDYLSHRQQSVQLDDIQSAPIEVSLGVPQGSVLGPVLFLIYVNDINNTCPEANLIKFADDTTLVTTGKTTDEAISLMNTALTKISRWFIANKLQLNPSKTRYIIFNNKINPLSTVMIGNEPIQKISEKGKEKSFKLVGIHLDENLKWTHHINAVSKKLSSSLYGLTRVSKELNEENKKLLYSGLIHSHLVYGLPIWGWATKGRLSELLVKQKRAIRKIYNLKYRDHTMSYFRKGNILQLPELVEHMTLCFIQSSTGKFAPAHIKKLWPIREKQDRLRGTNFQIAYPFSHKQYVNNLPPIAQAKLWNNDKQDKDVEYEMFKVFCKEFYLQKYDTQVE
jgi:hypothetical protein